MNLLWNSNPGHMGIIKHMIVIAPHLPLINDLTSIDTLKVSSSWLFWSTSNTVDHFPVHRICHGLSKRVWKFPNINIITDQGTADSFDHSTLYDSESTHNLVAKFIGTTPYNVLCKKSHQTSLGHGEFGNSQCAILMQ